MTLRSFKTFLSEEKKEAYFTFGRMNPPTIGHEKLLNALAERAGKSPYKIFLSPTQDSKKNPLLFEDKIKTARKIFPRHARSICNETVVRDIIGAAVALYEDGYKSIVMVVGDDRVNEFQERLDLYNGKKGKHGLYVFKSIKVESAGQRDPDAGGANGASSTKLREAANSGDFTTFSQGLPKNVSTMDAKRLFNDVRIGLGLTEEKSFRNHVKMKPISETREKYIRGDLFEVGDTLVITETQEIANLRVLGSNYVIVETADGKRLRKWLDDVEKLEE